MSRVLLALMVVLAGPASAQWRFSVSRDEMTGKQQAFANSPTTSPTRPMDFPYTSTRGWIGFGCDGENEWTYVGFTNQPNLLHTEILQGYNSISTRVRWDDSVETARFLQKWGDNFLSFSDDSAAIAHLTTASTVMLELDWYSAGQVYFRFPLRGASAAIAKARATCTK